MPKKKTPISAQVRAEFEATLGRLQEVTGCKTQVQLAEYLDIRQSSISDAKRRASIPSDWLLRVWRKTQVSPDWILYGNACGHKLAVPSDDTGRVISTIDPVRLRNTVKADLIKGITRYLDQM